MVEPMTCYGHSMRLRRDSRLLENSAAILDLITKRWRNSSISSLPTAYGRIQNGQVEASPDAYRYPPFPNSRFTRDKPSSLSILAIPRKSKNRHTYFFPTEQYDRTLIERLAEHCRSGWGEIEVHLHHGVEKPDNADNTRRRLEEFRDALVKHKCLSQWNGTGSARYAFVHGNFALANSAKGRSCGVDDEMRILAETGCYADLTLPSAPNVAQISKINALYECALPLDGRAPHRRGLDLTSGRPPQVLPLIIQGPLMLDIGRRIRGWPVPRTENSAITSAHPPTSQRLRLWRQARIVVRGRPNWLFIKLHCHGMDPRDEEAMLGAPMSNFLRDVVEGAKDGRQYKPHFVTAREMVNIALAACDGRDGNPGDYRDYRLRLIRSEPRPRVGSRLQRERSVLEA